MVPASLDTLYNAVLVHFDLRTVWSSAPRHAGLEHLLVLRRVWHRCRPVARDGDVEAVMPVAIRTCTLVSQRVASDPRYWNSPHLGGLLVCFRAHTAPATFLLQMQADGARYLLDAPGLLKAAVANGIPLHIAEPA